MRPQAIRPRRVHDFVSLIFDNDLHAKRVASLADATVGALHGAQLAVGALGRRSPWRGSSTRSMRSSRWTGSSRTRCSAEMGRSRVQGNRAWRLPISRRASTVQDDRCGPGGHAWKYWEPRALRSPESLRTCRREPPPTGASMTEVPPTLRASVRKVTGATQHSIAGRGGAVEVEAPVTVTVVAGEAGYLLLRLDAQGRCIADTWHATLDEAKAQAAFEFDIRDDEWSCTGK